MDGIEIFKLLREKNISHPHFDYYKERVRRIEHPTAEELEEYKRDREKDEKKRIQSEKFWKEKREEEEKNQGINRASYHLEKLKSKHNVK